MSEKERIEFIKVIKKLTEEVSKDKKAAKALLVEVGIITEKGNFRKPYRHLRFYVFHKTRIDSRFSRL